MSGRPYTVLVANRGEIAIRVMRTCRELGVRTVAVYSDADRASAHVRAADLAVRVGPAPSAASYLNMEAILQAAREAGADAIHPGYGFLSENSAFARRVGEEGLTFIGPPPEAIEAMGDKTRARRLMREAGVPIVPGTDGPIQSEREAAEFCEQCGFPVLLKAAAGGGGKGMRLVENAAGLAQAFRTASSEARSAFGDGRVYLERYLERPRHIEIQVLADMHGGVVHLGERECSIQRRHQKVIEESPSAVLTAALRDAMGETAVKAARACLYRNAGTIEFLFDASGNYYFLEMNTRLQVEHPVTELRTGLDLVALQLQIARGERLPFAQDQVQTRGHAIECRICAEDVANQYAPSTGVVTHLRSPQGPGVREDRGIEEGTEVSVYYDPMLSKLCVWAPTRAEAIDRMSRALAEYELLGVSTNLPLLRFVMGHPAFRRGEYSTHFLQDEFTPSALDAGSPGLLGRVAAVCALLEDRRLSALAEGDHGDDGAYSAAGRRGRSGWRAKRAD